MSRVMGGVDDVEAIESPRLHSEAPLLQPAEMGEENEMPLLPSCSRDVEFTWNVIKWPMFFVVVNLVVFGSLILHDDKDYEGWRERGDSSQKGEDDHYLAVRRSNDGITALILFLDTMALYFAATFVQKEVLVLDALRISNVDSEDALKHRHTVAYASCRADLAMGRSIPSSTFPLSRSGDSIGTSLLFLATVFCAVGAISSSSTWCFSWTSWAADVCTSPLYGVPQLPLELQDWALRRRDAGFYRRVGFAQLSDGSVFFGASDPRLMDNASLSLSDGRSGRRSIHRVAYSANNLYDPVLVLIRSNGTILYFPSVAYPTSFELVRSNDNDIPNRGFCCFYFPTKSASFPEGWHIAVLDDALSLLCVDPSDSMDFLINGIFRNVSIQRPSSNTIVTEKSLQWFGNCLWVMLTRHNFVSGKVVTEFYNVIDVDRTPLRLVSVANITSRSRVRFESYETEQTSCMTWRSSIQAVTSFVTLVLAYVWLSRSWGMAVGIVPAYCACCVGLFSLNMTLAVVVSYFASLVVFLALLGARIPCLIPLSSEELVWALYTGVLALFTMDDGGPFVLFPMIGVCGLIGTILGHPVLFLIGWAGGSASILFGVYALFKGQYMSWFWILFGLIAGSGLVTLGTLLTKYRPFVCYFLRYHWRGWQRDLQAGEAASHSRGQSTPLVRTA